MTEVEYLRGILKRCEKLSIVDGGDTPEEEFRQALDALDDIRGLVRVTLANPLPPFLEKSA